MILSIDFNTIVGIATIIGTLAACVSVYPIVFSWLKTKFLSLSGAINQLTQSELSYLRALIRDIENQNRKTNWSNEFYIPINVELMDQEEIDTGYIKQKYYLVNRINPNFKKDEFNDLSNIEKIDSSKGTTHNSFEKAIKSVRSNSFVLISPPGGGKTVSLRNYAITIAKERIKAKHNYIPIFINLGNYISKEEGEIIDFKMFLDRYFDASTYNLFMGDGKWKELLLNNRCIFILDAIDELPRRGNEFTERLNSINNFIENWPNTKFYLSCRERDYDKQLTFRQILIKPFTEAHISKYLNRFLKNKKNTKSALKMIKENLAIQELCTNPFYLNLVCIYIKASNKLPKNKTVLFNFILDKFLEREKSKVDSEKYNIFTDSFIKIISELAYHLSIEKMETTLDYEKYKREFKNRSNLHLFESIIELSIKSGLLEFNDKSKTLRFIHHRFQEFFCSRYILTKYHNDSFKLPPNFYTNLWWYETIIFLAGLEQDPDFLIKKLINFSDNYNNDNDYIKNLIKLDVTLLAFKCTYSSLVFNNQVLFNSIKQNLFDLYNRGNSLEKVKILKEFRLTDDRDTHDLLKKAINDESHWVSETAFFVLTNEKIKIPVKPLEIFKEFFRFFINGRLIKTILPVLKSAKSSWVMRFFLPLFFIGVIAYIICLFLIGYILFYFFDYSFFKLKLAFTYECLGCIASILVSSSIIIYFLFHADEPFFKRILLLAPLSVLILNYTYSPRVNYLASLTTYGLGLLTAYLYWAYKNKREGDFYTIPTFTVGFLFANLILPFTSKEIYLLGGEASEFHIFFSAILRPKIVESIPLGTVNIVDKYSKYYYLLLIIVFAFLLIKLLLNQMSKIKDISKFDSEIDTILSNSDDDLITIVKQVKKIIENINFFWGQKLFLQKFRTKLNDVYEKESVILIYNDILKSIKNSVLLDALYQQLEDEEKSFKRLL